MKERTPMPEEEFIRRWDAREGKTFADLREIFDEWEAEQGIRKDSRPPARSRLAA